jgi:hypothetical protein
MASDLSGCSARPVRSALLPEEEAIGDPDDQSDDQDDTLPADLWY